PGGPGSSHLRHGPCDGIIHRGRSSPEETHTSAAGAALRFIRAVILLLQAVILLAFLGAIAYFAWLNRQTVTINLPDRRLNTTVALLSVSVYVLGMLTGWTVVSFLRRSIRRVSEPQA